MRTAIFGAIRITSDILILFIIVVTMVILQKIEPFKDGYFPNDTTLMKPYKSSTVPSYILYIVSCIIMAATVIISELVAYRKVLSEKYHKIPVILYSLYDYLIVSAFGYLTTIAVTDVCKATAGRLRPNFFNACEPRAEVITRLNYVLNYTCTSLSKHDPKELRKSFPSGHSSIAMYSAIYLAVYLQYRFVRFRYAPIVRPLLQTIFLALGLFVCYSRIRDNKHHWSDVVFGALIGLFIAFSTPYFLPYSSKSKDLCDKPEQQTFEINQEMKLSEDRLPA